MKKLFYYNKEKCMYEKVNPFHYIHGIWLLALVFALGYFSRTTIVERILHTKVKTNTITIRPKKFNETELVELLNKCNIKYPYIVLAQAKLESNNFTSRIFLNNLNMFGMRKARQRITSAHSEKDTYAFYESWCDCVYDYCMYQSTVMCSVTTEEEYFAKLGEKYAEDPLYVSKLKNIIQKQKLKSLFEE
jgi:hypothetical protein